MHNCDCLVIFIISSWIFKISYFLWSKTMSIISTSALVLSNSSEIFEFLFSCASIALSIFSEVLFELIFDFCSSKSLPFKLSTESKWFFVMFSMIKIIFSSCLSSSLISSKASALFSSIVFNFSPCFTTPFCRIVNNSGRKELFLHKLQVTFLSKLWIFNDESYLQTFWAQTEHLDSPFSSQIKHLSKVDIIIQNYLFFNKNSNHKKQYF